ncbi:hypothetical protein ACM46_20750 [Chryseobacterium angstadtii]|uniref:SusD/RagB family nutrient-binding outer membrane lipoprotein n=1 Tax=Chryseobacterium angstadtii TaxID=558151 RepID=A0A0J7HZQ1_9FLAO|nr:SusD/RagB family nutrient-binding outer membrane lipoprotein [Chryseobacterium angstadtii]KMQ59517.1 hypothetical protein ACM46_20750 [Chryseobacterium angstadtii]
MKNIGLKTIIAASFLMVTATSCSTDYLDVNKNENNAYENQITPAERLSAAETVVYRTQGGLANRLGNTMMNAWVGNHYFYAAPLDEEMKMQATSTFYNGIWDNYYRGVSNYQSIIDYPDTTNKYGGYIAIARVMKAFYMQTIVDLYNDAPYSEAFRRQANLTPKYDKGADIYKALVAEVNLAIASMNAGATLPSTAVGNNSQDPIMQGDMVKWLQMAYTVKLKLLTRLSMCTDAGIKTMVTQELATMPTTTATYLTSDVTINPGYSSSNANSQNPLYRNFGLRDVDSGELSANYRLYFATKHILDDLGGLSSRTTGVVDGRRSRMYRNNGIAAAGASTPSLPAAFRGLVQGAPKEGTFTEGDFTTLGPAMFYIALAAGSAQNGIIMSAAESKFLQAEAAVVYPAMSGLGGQARFDEGIAASFTFLAVPTTGATTLATYMAGIATKPGIGWTATANKLECIQYQKWIALTNINPLETYIGYTKTGFPVTPMPIGASFSNRPVRLMYPQSEYIANGANVPNPALTEMYSKTSQYAPFWLK